MLKIGVIMLNTLRRKPWRKLLKMIFSQSDFRH